MDFIIVFHFIDRQYIRISYYVRTGKLYSPQQLSINPELVVLVYIMLLVAPQSFQPRYNFQVYNIIMKTLFHTCFVVILF